MSFIRRQVGLRTDEASASGSLHAKIGDVKSYLSSLQKPRSTVAIGSGTPTPGSTLLEVSGKGVLTWLWLWKDFPTPYGGVRITIDGVVVGEGGQSGGVPGQTYWFCAGQGSFMTVTGPVPISLEYKSSLKIEGVSGYTGTNLTKAYWIYAQE